MKKAHLALALIAAAGTTGAALAQDSVSNIPSPQPAGATDALDAYDAAAQVAKYIVDGAGFTTSWGTEFNIFPLVKGSADVDGDFETGLISAQGISGSYADSALQDAFLFWDTQGAGINADFNEGAILENVSIQNTKQFGALFGEFGGNLNGVITAVANIDPANPDRVYVRRSVAMTNGLNAAENTAQVGVGSIDAFGFAAIRGDDFGSTGSDIVGNNLFMVDSLARSNGTVNRIWNDPAVPGTFNADDAAATSLFIENFGDPIVAPNILPSDRGGPLPATTTFPNDFILPDLPSEQPFANSNTRGAVSYSSRPALNSANGVASYGILSAGAETQSIQIADVAAGGTVIGGWQEYFGDPSQFNDPTTGFDLNAVGLSPLWNFAYYRSQVPFRGGTAPHDIAADPSGATLAVAVVDVLNSENPVLQAAVAAMRDTDNVANGNEDWSLVAYQGDVNFVFTSLGRGKPVTDGAGEVIGYMSSLLELTNGATDGPSISGVSFDALGNVWFTAPVELVDDPNDGLGNPSTVAFDQTQVELSLLRAVYNPADHSYELELVARQGDVFQGQNSDRQYQLGFISLADGNSISSGAFFGGNAMDTTFLDTPLADIDGPADARSTGGVVLSAEIIYDANNDGTFSFDTELAGDDDESYNTLLYIAANLEVQQPCQDCPDVNGDGAVTPLDISAVLGAFGTSGLPAGTGGDTNCDGAVTPLDISNVLGAFGQSGLTCAN